MCIVAGIPSRGLIHSRVIEAVYLELGDGEDGYVVYSHNKKLPEGHNEVVDKALYHKATWIWLVEEDVYVPYGILDKMMKAVDCTKPEGKVVAAKYKLHQGGWNYMLDTQGNLIFAGTGCLLVHSSIFRILPKPWFRTDTAWSVDEKLGLRNPYLDRASYGGHDIDFFGRLKEQGITGTLIDVECQHLYVAAYGKAGSNDGCHTIKAIG